MNSNVFQRPESVEHIGTTAKNNYESIRVDLTQWRGQSYVDVRVFTEDDRPTARGITAHANVWRELVELVGRALEELDRRAEGDR